MMLSENEQLIGEWIIQYCDEVLNNEYLEVCKNIKLDYLDLVPDGMNRGKPEIWAASIIWAAGSVNFLSDKSFLPFATLGDVSAYFNTKKSTVGYKATQIRKILSIDYFNARYLFKSSSILKTMDSIRMTEDGFIVFDPPLPSEESPVNIATIEDEEDDGDIDEFTLVGKSKKPFKRPTFLQYEYFVEQKVKKWIKSDGRERTIEIDNKNFRKISIQVSCTFTEAVELEEWMKKEGLL